jgi:predicted HTH domain antitoxin
MQVNIVLPDDIAHSLETRWGNLDRKILEMVAIEVYREGSISTGKIRELLGMATRLEADAWLQSQGVDLHYSNTDFDDDRHTHVQLRQTESF